MKKIALGIDFGTLSARAIAVRTTDGHELGFASAPYPHKVMDSELICPSGNIKLPPKWALQDPSDYLFVLKKIIKDALASADADPQDVIGVSVDFTTCTLIPTDRSGKPLCFYERFACEPHAYAKLWKHHSAQKYSEAMTELALSRGEKWLQNYGGHISSEWMFPKIAEILNEAPEIYKSADCFIDAADWIVWMLTGKPVRNACIAGHKALWNAESGYPSKDFFKAFDPRLENCVEEKLPGEVRPIGSVAGYISDSGSALSGLPKGIAVGVGCTDSHVAAPALKALCPGQLMILLGTSSVMLVSSEAYHPVPGICGIIKGSIVPEYWEYEAGLACLGDAFAWFSQNCISDDLKHEALNRKVNIIDLLVKKIGFLAPGECGMLALNWWNGNRNPIGNADLSGMFLGMSLNTTSVDMFRSLVESMAFGTRLLVENFKDHDVDVNEIVASGGISQKCPEIMQIFADIIGIGINVPSIKEGPALGASIYAALAAGSTRGGYDEIWEASEKMGVKHCKTYYPNMANHEIYNKIYAEYLTLVNYFGRGENLVMRKLREYSKTL